MFISRNPPRVSIVIPAHNEEKMIAAAIENAQRLRYPDYEIIVVNNASTDRTGEIAQKHNIKVVDESRRGLLYAREAGRLAASGEIIANLDADCLPDMNWLMRAVPYFKDKRVVAVSAGYDYYDAGPFVRYLYLFFHNFIYGPINVLLRLLGKGAIIVGGNNLIRASALQAVGGYDTSILFYGEDADTAKRVSHIGTVIYTRRIIIKSSGRRFYEQGPLRTIGLYVLSFFKVLFGAKLPNKYG